jgi:beta-glucanase (GH16 family)
MQVVVLSIVAMMLPRLPNGLIAQQRYLVWSDEFIGPSIDTSQWQFDRGSTNDNIQYYTSRIENAQISGGILQIIARKESYAGFSYTSALLQTRNAVSWRYGRIEARIKVPGTPGFVPAFWMMPEDGMYGWWPGSGEIDIMEYPTTQGGMIYGTLHAQAYNYSTGLGSTFTITDAETTFHTYAVEWTPEQIDFFVDQNKYFTVTNDHTGHQKWPFDQPFYLIINLAVGGAWVGAPTQNTVFPATMEVDYVRVYQMLNDIGISGKDYVALAAQGVTYSVPQIAGGAYAWTVPSTAQIVAGQHTSTITVDWGTAGGDVSAITTITSGSDTSHYLVTVSDNLLSNPGFEKGVKYWTSVMSPLANGSFGLDTLTASHVGHSVRTIVNATPANPWDVQISQQRFNLEAGKHYEGRLWAKAAVGGAKLNAAVIDAQSYAFYGGTTFILTTLWQEYSFRFTAPQNAAGSFNMDMGLQPATYYCDDVALINLDAQTGIKPDGDPGIPHEYSLEQNYPNPFNPVTGIKFELPKTSRLNLRVFDILGREVAILVNDTREAGVYEVKFDGSNLASGLYFYRLQAGSFVQTRKLLLVR